MLTTKSYIFFCSFNYRCSYPSLNRVFNFCLLSFLFAFRKISRFVCLDFLSYQLFACKHELIANEHCKVEGKEDEI